MPFFGADDKKIYYEMRGQGEAIVLVHGVAVDSRYWGDLPQFLSRKFSVVTYDLRGHGKSFAPDTGYAFRDHAADLKGLISELGFAKVTLLGHSLGGAIALKYALEQGNSVKSLVLAAPHVVGYRDYTDWPNVYRTARTIDLAQAKIQWETFRLFARLKAHPEAWQLFLNCLNDFPGKVWLDQQANKYIDESDLTLLDNLTVPVLLLCGRDDLDFLPLAKLINARLVSGSMFEIPDCGHMIHLERPEIFRRELATFLKL